ncbi:MAG: ATP-binding protein [Phycisphaerae bacterium]|nr:ATP-binding protein [Phycisphaerae bacterium]
MEDGEFGNSVNLRILANPEELPRIRDALRSVVDRVGFTGDEPAQVVLAIDEALANVITHGYGGPCAKPIDICVSPLSEGSRAGIRVSIRDFGRQVDPVVICGRDLDDVRPGGLGVHIMRTVMDEVEYKAAEGTGMRVTMTKWVK